MDQLKQQLASMIAEIGYVDKDLILANPDVNLFDKGYIDSFGFIALIASIESDLNVELDGDDFSDESSMTLHGLVRVLSSKE